MLAFQTLYQTASFCENKPLFASQNGQTKTFANLDFQHIWNFVQNCYFLANKPLSASQNGKILWEKVKLLQISISAFWGLGFQPLYKTASF